MKKLFSLIILLMTFILSSCSLLNHEDALNEGYNKLNLEQMVVTSDFELPRLVDGGFWHLQVDWESSSPLITIDGNIARVDFISNKEKDSEVELTATISLFSQSITKIFYLMVPKYDLGEISAKKVNFGNRLDLDGPLTEGCLPSTGSPKVLVIPINLDPRNETLKILNDINIAFNGTSEQTGYESVKSYYQKSSYGKLNIKFEVMKEWFTPKYNKMYYNNYYDEKNDADGSTLLLQEALKYYDSKINFNDYDSNGDGYIDSVWLIYNCDVNFRSLESIYWAYTYWDYSDNTYDDKYAYFYAIAGTDFMYPSENEDLTYNTNGLNIDSHTYIHETGHLLGLDDYYDYNEYKGAEGGLYGADMMDSNVGDHAAISKLLLGWLEPTIVLGAGDITLDLLPFVSTGECLIIAEHRLTSIYDTYYIVEFYTNDGLNSFVKPIDDYGIRITKINALFNIVDGEITFNDGDYQCGFKYDNSDERQLFVDMVCNGKVKYNGYSLNSNVLYKEKDTLKNKNIFFELTVNSCNNQTTNITISIS